MPTLILHALDNPINYTDSIPIDALVSPRDNAHSNVMDIMIQRGGHIGWPTGWFTLTHGVEYSTNRTLKLKSFPTIRMKTQPLVGSGGGT